MGNEVSTDNRPKVGYHVLQVHPSGPGKDAGLISFFDFIVSADGVVFDKEDNRFVKVLKEKIGQPVQLVVYNTRTETTRETSLVPSDSWGGNGLAGISIRFCSFENAHEYVWHVLEIYPDSPASDAGLEARTDYIVGTPELLFNDADDFFTLININDGKPVPLYVFSTKTDDVRLISIIPNQKWGGTGSLGCDVGFGILHRIPTLDPATLDSPAKFQKKVPTAGHIQAEIPKNPSSPPTIRTPEPSSLTPNPTSPLSPTSPLLQPGSPPPYPPGFTTPQFPHTPRIGETVDWSTLGEASTFVNSNPSSPHTQPKPHTEFQDVKF